MAAKWWILLSIYLIFICMHASISQWDIIHVCGCPWRPGVNMDCREPDVGCWEPSSGLVPLQAPSTELSQPLRHLSSRASAELSPFVEPVLLNQETQFISYKNNLIKGRVSMALVREDVAAGAGSSLKYPLPSGSRVGVKKQESRQEVGPGYPPQSLRPAAYFFQQGSTS